MYSRKEIKSMLVTLRLNTFAKHESITNCWRPLHGLVDGVSVQQAEGWWFNPTNDNTLY